MSSGVVLDLPVFAPGSLGYQCTVSCKAACCKYLSLPLETPRTAEDFDNVRWYLMHEDTHVYKYGSDWYLLVNRRCRNLTPQNLCAIYDRRPKICADYDPTDCEFTGEVDFDLYFRNEQDFEAWLAVRRLRRAESARKAARTRRRNAAAARARHAAPAARPKRRRG